MFFSWKTWERLFPVQLWLSFSGKVDCDLCGSLCSSGCVLNFTYFTWLAPFKRGVATDLQNPNGSDNLHDMLPSMMSPFHRWVNIQPSHGSYGIHVYIYMYIPKFDIASEKWWLEDYFPFGMAYFQGLCYINFQGGISIYKYISIYIYLPRTQMTLVLVRKGLVLRGWPSKIEVSWVLLFPPTQKSCGPCFSKSRSWRITPLEN